jgi:hypothetical protein
VIEPVQTPNLYGSISRSTYSDTDHGRSAVGPHRDAFAVDPATCESGSIPGLDLEQTIERRRATMGLKWRPIVPNIPTNEIGARLLGRRAKCVDTPTIGLDDHVHDRAA